jgi:hypothetical protein
LEEIGRYLRDKNEEESAFGRRMLVAVGELDSLGFVDEERVPKVLDDPFRATVMFAYALKTWEQGRLDRAADWFGRIADAAPWAEAPWMEGYRMLARQYVADAERLERADHDVRGKDEEQLQSAMGDLEDLCRELETRGRGRFNVRSWQIGMARRIRVLRMEAEVVDWRKLKDTVLEMIRAGRIADGLGLIRNVDLERDADRRQREALVWLLEQAGGLQDGLVRRLAAGNLDVTLLTREGKRYVGVVGSKPEGLVVDEGGKPRLLGWNELAPEVLLQLHQLFAQGVEEDEQERLLGQAVAYAALSGMRDEAERLAAVLAGVSGEFAERWKLVRAEFPEQ